MKKSIGRLRLSASVALALMVIGPMPLSAQNAAGEFAESVGTKLAEITLITGKAAIEGENVSDAAVESTLLALADQTIDLAVSAMIEAGFGESLGAGVRDPAKVLEAATKIVKETYRIELKKAASISSIKSMGTDVFVSFALDIASETYRDQFGGAGSVSGQGVYLAIQQAKVVYAFATGGVKGAIVAQSMFTVEQLIEVNKLAAEFKSITQDNYQKSAVNAAIESASALRDDYKRADTAGKIRIENEIRDIMQSKLIYTSPGSIFTFPPKIPQRKVVDNSQTVIDIFLRQLKKSDETKYATLENLVNMVGQASDANQVLILKQRAIKYAQDNFSFPEFISARLDVEAKSEAKLLQLNQLSANSLAISEPAPEIATFTTVEEVAALASVQTTAPTPPVVEDKVTPASVIIDNRILEIQRRRAEEAAQAERALLAEQQRQARLASIAALEAERTKQFLVKLDAEARIKNNDNRLAILNFDEREKVQRVLSVVDTESARLLSTAE